MPRTNLLYVEVRVYPASIEEGRHTGYDMGTLLIAEQPVLSTYENLFDIHPGEGELVNGLARWITGEIFTKGKELIYQNCPKAPE